MADFPGPFDVDTIVIRTTDPAVISRAMELTRGRGAPSGLNLFAIPPLADDERWFVESIDTQETPDNVSAVIKLIGVRRVTT